MAGRYDEFALPLGFCILKFLLIKVTDWEILAFSSFDTSCLTPSHFENQLTP